MDSDRFAVESKERDTDIPAWIKKGVEQAVQAASTSDKLPLVLIHQKGDLYINDLAVMRWQDFERLLDDPITDELQLEREIPAEQYDYEEDADDDESSVLVMLQERIATAVEILEIYKAWDGNGEFVLSSLPTATLLAGRRKARQHRLYTVAEDLYTGMQFGEVVEETDSIIAAFVAHIYVTMNVLLQSGILPLNEYIAVSMVIGDSLDEAQMLMVAEVVHIADDTNTRLAMQQLTGYILSVIRDMQDE